MAVPLGDAHRDVVLVVDDEPEILEIVGSRLERAFSGIIVHQALSGERALDLLREHRVDLIITDQTMPGMSGTEFLGRAREIAPDVPRMMLTARHDANLAIDALNSYRIAAFHPKPLDFPSFLESIGAVLAARRAAKLHEATFERATRVLGGEARPEERDVP